MPNPSYGFLKGEDFRDHLIDYQLVKDTIEHVHIAVSRFVRGSVRTSVGTQAILKVAVVSLSPYREMMGLPRPSKSLSFRSCYHSTLAESVIEQLYRLICVSMLAHARRPVINGMASRRYATGGKVASSRPDEVIEFIQFT
jgi:hypothetical protein